MGSWGQDFDKTVKFSTLIESILKNTDTPRLRLSSLEPWDIERDFFSLWSDDRLARHLHLPLQSGCRVTLKRMARKTTPEAYAQLVETARAAVPDVAITTDIIVGFPGETESEFTESLSYTAQMNFARGHVFTYSERPGTAASQMPGSVPYPVRKFRNAEMRKVLEGTEQSYRNRFIGKHLPVLWESTTALGPKSWRLQGLTDNYLRITSVAPEPLWNQIQLVEITGSNGTDLVGKIVEM